jgi:hypothetical protein
MFFHYLNFFFVIHFDGQRHFFNLLDFGTILGFDSLLKCNVFHLVFCLLSLDFIQFGLKLFDFIFQLMFDFSELLVFFIADFDFGPHLVELILEFGYFSLSHLEFCDLLLKLSGFLVMGADCLLNLKDFLLQLFIFGLFLKKFNFHLFCGIYQSVKLSIQLFIQPFFAIHQLFQIINFFFQIFCIVSFLFQLQNELPLVFFRIFQFNFKQLFLTANDFSRKLKMRRFQLEIVGARRAIQDFLSFI